MMTQTVNVVGAGLAGSGSGISVSSAWCKS